MGIWKLHSVEEEDDGCGGEGKAGVAGMGVGFAGPGRRLRGSSFGIRSLRLGMEDAFCCVADDEAGGLVAMCGICMMG